MKILVTGNAGSGKSTLGKKIAASLGLPFYSLDRIVWQEGWKKTPLEEQSKQIAKLTAQNDWIIDGVSYEVQDAADVVIFLDTPRHVCYWRAFKRNRKHLFSSRPELPPNCPEILIIPTLVKIIWRFPKRVRPKLLARQHKSADAFVHIMSKNELENFLENGLSRLPI